MIVVDASVIAVALADDGNDGEHCRARLKGERLAAPALIDLEVLSVLRGLVRAGRVDAPRAQAAVDDLASLPIGRAGHPALLPRCWELRENLTPYDAAYVALAEILETTLVTGDRRLSRATDPRCPIEVIDACHGDMGARKPG